MGVQVGSPFNFRRTYFFLFTQQHMDQDVRAGATSSHTPPIAKTMPATRRGENPSEKQMVVLEPVQ